MIVVNEYFLRICGASGKCMLRKLYVLICCRIGAFRDKSIDKWHRKTQVTTGAAAIKGKLQAFNQVSSCLLCVPACLLCVTNGSANLLC